MPRIKSGQGQCPKCDNIYADLLEHISKRHRNDRFTQEEVHPAGLMVCVCGRVVLNQSGLVKHQLRFGCLGSQSRLTSHGQPVSYSRSTFLPTRSITSSLTTLPPSTSCSSTPTPVPSSSCLTSLISSPHNTSVSSLANTSHPLLVDLTLSPSPPARSISPVIEEQGVFQNEVYGELENEEPEVVESEVGYHPVQC